MNSAVKPVDEFCTSTSGKYPNRILRLFFKLLLVIEDAAHIRAVVRVMDTGLAWMRRGCWLLTGIGIVTGIHLTLRASSDMQTVWWLPSEIGHWCEGHGRLRNVPAFFLLALPVLVALRRPGQRVAAMLSLSFFGAMLELLQLGMPGRWFEWQDIALTWCGIWMAWGFSETSRALLRRLREEAAIRLNHGYRDASAGYARSPYFPITPASHAERRQSRPPLACELAQTNNQNRKSPPFRATDGAL